MYEGLPFSVYHITKRMRHHGNRAGYNQLLGHVPSANVAWAADTALGRLTNGVTRRGLRPLSGSAWYGAAGLYAELRTAALARRVHASLVHVMYGEDLLGLSKRLIGPKRRLIGTFHQPPERIEQLIRARVFKQCDAIIVLDDQNADWWRDQVPIPIHPLSLGLDTEWWSPGDRPRGQRVVFVGNHLRDFEALCAAATHFGGRVGFDAVVPKDRAEALREVPGLTTHVGISDEALRELYRSAAVMFLPLRGASASNSILQAMACGCPIVATDLPSIRRCTGPDGVFAPRGDVSAHVRALAEVLKSERLPRLSDAAWLRSADYAWPLVGQRHLDVYREVMARGAA